VFGNLSDRLAETFRNLRGKGRLSPADIDATLREIRKALLEADVTLEVVKNFIQSVRDRALGDEVSSALNPAQQVVQIVKGELIKILGSEPRKLRYGKTAPTVIMLAGLQGSGKTTLAGKLAKWLVSEGETPLLVAADLQRPNAVEQLRVLGEKISVEVFAPEAGSGSGDPVKVAKESISHAKSKGLSFVIVDTAGRLGVDQEMMQQAAKIRVSVASVTGKPIIFTSTGEGLDAFEPFYPDRMASRILDMGDVLTLIEQAQKAFDDDTAQEMALKLAKETFTLEDFLEQMQQLRKMGSLKSMLAMMPGAGQMRQQLDNIDEKEIDRTEAIIKSMTPVERNAAKMMKTVAKGGTPQVPGMPAGLGGVVPRKKAKDKKKGGSKSGNPAKRAAELNARELGIKSAGSGAGSAFGIGN